MAVDYCINCPMRLYNSKYHNFKPVGVPISGKIVILPNVDYQSYKKLALTDSSMIDIIRECIGLNATNDDLYYVPFIRCNETISCKVNNDIINNCLNYLNQEFVNYKFCHILVLGNAVERMMHINIADNIDYTYVNKYGQCYSINYNPLIKFIDNDKFDIFSAKIRSWYMATFNYGYTNMIRI